MLRYDSHPSREALQAEREAALARTLDLVFERHPYYRDLFRREGLRREHFKTLDDLSRIPVTTKAQYMAEPQRFVLESEGLEPEMRTVWDVMYTTGSTSGVPTPFVSTSYDFFNILKLQRNMLLLRGVQPTDLIANLFPITTAPHGAWIRVLHAAASLQVPVLSAMPGNPSPHFELGRSLDEVIALLGTHHPTILWGVPSYIQRVLTRAAELGTSLSKVRKVFVTGEALSDIAREHMMTALVRAGAEQAQISVSYGSTEMQGGMIECRPGAGFHNPLPAQFLVDIAHSDTGQPVPEGKSGSVLLTHLARRGTLLLRYALGDVSVLSREPCPHCGAVTDRLVQTPRRADSLVKIKGMLVNPDVVIATLERRLGACPFVMSIERDSDAPLAADRLRLRVEGASGVGSEVGSGGASEKGLSGELARLVKEACGVTPEVIQVPVGALQSDSRWKMQRFIDQRGKAGA